MLADMSLTESEVFEQLRPELVKLAYRMTGLWTEAEDLVQEAWLRFSTQKVDSARPYLYRVVTRLCLDHLKSARHRREAYVGPWLPEPMVEIGVDEEVEAVEQLTLGLMVALEHLSPLERAAFLLHQVYGYAYSEIGALLGRSEAACRKLSSRARARLQERRPRLDSAPSQPSGVLFDLVQAVRSGDVERVVTFLREDAVLTTDGGGKAIAALRPVLGRDKIARFFVGIARKASPAARLLSARVGGLPGLVIFEGEACVSAMAFEIQEGKLGSIWIMRNPDKLTSVRPAESAPSRWAESAPG